MIDIKDKVEVSTNDREMSEKDFMKEIETTIIIGEEIVEGEQSSLKFYDETDQAEIENQYDPARESIEEQSSLKASVSSDEVVCKTIFEKEGNDDISSNSTKEFSIDSASEEISETKSHFRKLSKVTVSDIESIFTFEGIILPKFIDEPILLSDVYTNMRAIKESEFTERMVKHASKRKSTVKTEDVYIFERERTIMDYHKEKDFRITRTKPEIKHLKKHLLKLWPNKDAKNCFDALFNLKSVETRLQGKKKSKKEKSKVRVECSEILNICPEDFKTIPYRFSQVFLISMCQKYDQGYWDLVLQGREVEANIGRRIEDADIMLIFEFLSYNEEIRYVDLSYNNITTKGLALIAVYVSLSPNIIGLNVMNNEITHISKLTKKRLGEKSNIQQLRLNGNPLKKLGCINAGCLLKYNKLKLLDLGETSQNLRTISWLNEFVRISTSIEVLDISRVLGQKGYNLRTYHLAYHFSEMLAHNESLVELHLQKNRLNDFDIQQLMEGLVKHPKLEVIDLSCNDLCDYGAEIIAKSLPNTKALTTLILACNKIRNAGVRALSMKLPFSKVTVLNLARNQVGDEGMIDLMHIIRKPYPLKALFIFGNPFSTMTLEISGQILSTT